ncbi:ATP-binding protein [Streptomyces sp. DG2A-72]|uniref:ATP-binding protein n=1 Tax=Streptomyces sp. DG2A-72 TaxID=3051386 RepID=UPI00265BAAA9|nr:ATP-binding protein [Streptomyces sp. DG2A-72]MDO0939087.1 ATP-binding protein [Streptomyces sp. DG2A-72]
MSGTIYGPVVQVSGAEGDVSVALSPERPVYRVDNFPFDRPRLTSDQARAQPVRLLQARYQSVEFTGRAAELARLARWRDGPDTASVLLLHGPGGQGKTRMATQFAHESHVRGWRVLEARHSTQVASAASSPAPVADEEGALLIADYAERWPTADLLEMLTDAVRQRGRSARVLLICRAAGMWWQSLAHRLDNLGLPAEKLALGPLADEPGLDIGTLFVGAVRTFAAALAVPGAVDLAPPMPAGGRWADRGFGRVLAVHMAALATVDRWLQRNRMSRWTPWPTSLRTCCGANVFTGRCCTRTAQCRPTRTRSPTRHTRLRSPGR